MSDVCHACGRQEWTLVHMPAFVIPGLGAEPSIPLARLKFASRCKGQDRPQVPAPTLSGLTLS